MQIRKTYYHLKTRRHVSLLINCYSMGLCNVYMQSLTIDYVTLLHHDLYEQVGAKNGGDYISDWIPVQ